MYMYPSPSNLFKTMTSTLNVYASIWNLEFGYWCFPVGIWLLVLSFYLGVPPIAFAPSIALGVALFVPTASPQAISVSTSIAHANTKKERRTLRTYTPLKFGIWLLVLFPVWNLVLVYWCFLPTSKVKTTSTYLKSSIFNVPNA